MSPMSNGHVALRCKGSKAISVLLNNCGQAYAIYSLEQGLTIKSVSHMTFFPPITTLVYSHQ